MAIRVIRLRPLQGGTIISADERVLLWVYERGEKTQKMVARIGIGDMVFVDKRDKTPCYVASVEFAEF